MSSILDVSELKRAEELSRQHEEKNACQCALSDHGRDGVDVGARAQPTFGRHLQLQPPARSMFLQNQKLDPEMLKVALEKARDQAQRAGQVIKSVHEFVRKRETARVPTSLAELISNLLPLIELQTHSAHVRVQLEMEEQLPLVAADRFCSNK